MGGTLGSIFGSAIGGIAGGPHGSDVGTVIGMVGGAVAGAAIGQATDQKRQPTREQHYYGYQDGCGHSNDSYGTSSNSGSYDSGYDSNNGGDDRIYDFKGSDYCGNYSAQQPDMNMPMESSVEDLAENLKYTPNIEIKNARFVDDNQNGKIERGEMSKVIFEVYNRSSHTLYDVVPTVVETTGNRHIMISPNMHVESIQPGKGIRYTALVKADNRLKNGTAKFCASVVQGDRKISKVCEFDIPTTR